MNIFKWLSAHGQQLYGKFACIIGEYHAKLEFTRLPPDVRTQGSILFHHVQAKPELKSVGEVLVRQGGSIIFQLFMLISEIKFGIDIFHGVSCNIKCLQSFQMHIYNRK